MGDTGSLALGGAVSAIAILLNLPLILPIAGGIYFMRNSFCNNSSSFI